MNSTNNNTLISPDPLSFHQFYGAGLSPSLLLFYALPFVLASIGMVFNGSLVYVTFVCRKHLNGSLNVLIALDALASMVWQWNSVVPFLIALSGANFVPAPLCFWLTVPGTFGIGVQQITMLYIAVERLFCILFPILPLEILRTSSKLLFVAFAFSLGWGLYLNVITFQGLMVQLQDNKLLCYSGDMRVAWVKGITYTYTLWMEIATTCAYMVIWTLMLRGALKKQQVCNSRNMHVLKALSWIMGLLIVGWMLNGTSVVYLPWFGLSATATFYYLFSLTCLSLVSLASNAPLLYMIRFRRSEANKLCFRESGIRKFCHVLFELHAPRVQGVGGGFG